MLRHVACVALLLALTSACSHTPSDQSRFSLDNARAHVQMLAASIGSRPTGTDANRRARDYIVSQLQSCGFSVRVQEADGSRPLYGATAHVRNIIASKPGLRGQAIALVTHYDSVPDGPGAADDALGCAVCLEAGRVLGLRDGRNYALVLVFTDGEELGLMGASAVMRDPIANWIQAVLNFEAVGDAGSALLFQTGPDSGNPLRAWATAAPQPAGSSLMNEVYRVLPNDTDMTIFSRASIPGLNFATVEDSYPYHTALDAAERLEPSSIQQMGENAVATVEALDRMDITDKVPSPTTYFDVMQRSVVSYGQNSLVVFAAAILLAVFGWIMTLSAARESAGLARVLLTGVWAIVVTALCAGAMTAAAWLFRAVSGVNHPWYAHPDRFLVLQLAAGFLTGWLLVKIGMRLPRRIRGSAHPSVAWSLILPLWIGMAIVAQRRLPGAAFVAVLPLGLAGIAAVVFSTRNSALAVIGATIVLVVTAALSMPGARILYHFIFPLLGRAPVVTPVYLYPALLLLCSALVLPALLALVASASQRLRLGSSIVGVSLAVLLVAAFVLCVASPAYTTMRPRQRILRYVNDQRAGQARWEIGGNEAGTDAGEGAPIAGPWKNSEPFDSPTPLDLSRWPFRYSALASVKATSPLHAAGSLKCDSSDCFADVDVSSDVGGATAVMTLPRGLVPEETNFPGATSDGVFKIIYAAVPPGGVTFRVRVGRADAEKVKGMALTAIVAGVPGAQWPQLPAWLSTDRVVWHARSYFVAPVPFK